MSRPVTPESVRQNEQFLRSLESDLMAGHKAGYTGMTKVVFSVRIAKVVVQVLKERGLDVVIGYTYGGDNPKAYIRMRQ